MDEHVQIADLNYYNSNSHSLEDFYSDLLSYNGNKNLLLKQFKDNNFDPSIDDNSIIVYSCHWGWKKIIKKLLKDPRVDPSAQNNQAIYNAVSSGRLEIVKILLKHKVDPSDRQNRCLKAAIKNKHFEMASLLLKDVRVDWRDCTHIFRFQKFLKEYNNKIKNNLVFRYLYLNYVVPQIKMDKKRYNKLPKTILKKICYLSVYLEIRDKWKSKIPPIELASLANILNINHDQIYDLNISKEEFYNLYWVL